MTIQNRGPRHAGRTREMPLVGYTPQHQAPEKPEPVNPHLAADGSKVHSWPLATPAVDPNPTGAYTVQHEPHPRPNVTIEPTMTQADARSLHNIFFYLAGVAVLVALVLAVVAVVNP